MGHGILSFPKTQDDQIHNDICRQIAKQPEIQSQEINIEVKKGVVVLTGSVETCLERLEAEKAAQAVYGVLSVTNLIQVRPKFVRTDDAIAHDVAVSLKSVTNIMDVLPTVTVHNGVVMLDGIVRGNRQRQDAEQAAQAIYGVRQIFNFLQVRTHNLPAPCRHARHQDATPSMAPRQQTYYSSSTRPLFIVPSLVGRA